MSGPTRYHHNLVLLRLSDVPNIPTDLGPLTIVYSKGDAQDVLVLVEGAVDLTVRTEYATPLEESAVKAALRDAGYSGGVA